MSKSLNNLIYFLFEDKLANFQHGYRRGKGTHTALNEVFKRIFLEKNKLIYEFDFKSFFNRVSVKAVHTYLQTRSQELADLVAKTISLIEYKIDGKLERMPNDGEIFVYGKAKLNRKNAKSKPFVVRAGLPQGLSISPILATLVLELFPIPKGLVMCADDGLIITDNENLEEFRN